MNGPTDRHLVERFLRLRSEADFRRLYREHTPYLLCLARRLLGGRREEAEDALQETWIRAAQGLAGFSWRSTLRSWLAGILINCCRELRRRPAGPGTAGEPPAGDRPPMASAAGRGGATAGGGAERLDLERLIAALPDGQREVLVLFDLEGYTHDEIGRRLGIPSGTSKSRLFEARRALRRGLAPPAARPAAAATHPGDAS